ncbi:endo-1,4-beta-xylanase [Pullulanibacillus sp. KACC 23026]|uniref:endo-1,4-beta-xylanase n=1 Tax=Pullulanibacillus sp. KACC 23026 TaxID=3028315 RepID=UPI0023AF471D|nr:endo-1,4-beta-xylanase [Pullulanibacillus sp. KACC 23026]WEG13239.1 endo-1,4-beta-xylanase [Pullulanibacillus sp. KACC 23026]
MNKKFGFKHSMSILMAVILAFGALLTLPAITPAHAESTDVKTKYTFDFNPADQATEQSWFTPSSASQVAWKSGSGLGVGDDDVLQGTHTGTDYTSANNAIRLTLPEALPAGYTYNIQVSFYVPSALNKGKSTITGPGVVLNGGYSNGQYKLPSSPGTIPMDTWQTVNVTTPVMTDDLTSVDFRFVTNTAENHPDVWYIDHIVISQVGDPKPVPTWDLSLPSLANTYKDSFLVGNVIEPNQLDTKTTNMFKSYYNVVTPENAMKPASLSTAKGVYDFTNADSIVNWAEQNGIAVHGHTLVWYQQSPDWLNKNSDGTPLTRSEARQNLHDYITKVAGHFAGKVISWDVVNEALDGGSLPVTNWKDDARKSPWYLAYANGADTSKGESGADYIYDAFVYAREADPNAMLYYNDYNETDAWKREAIAQMVEDLNKKWLKDKRNTDPSRKLIEGVGMQSHYYTSGPDPSQVEATIQRFIQAGVKISVSELDVGYGSYGGTAYPTLTQDQQVTQADYYARLFEIYKAYADHIQRVTVWGKADSQSWRSTNSPVLFDSLFAPKQAYYAVLDPSGYLEKQGQTPRPLYDLTVSTPGASSLIAGLPAVINVKAAAADLGNYKLVAYLTKDGVTCSAKFPLFNGKGKIVIPRAPEAGQYSVVVDAYNGSTLFASKAVPLTIAKNKFEVNVSGTTLNYSLDHEGKAVFKPTVDQLHAILNSDSPTIKIDLSGDKNVTGIRFTVPTEPFKKIDKTLEFTVLNKSYKVKTKTIWNNSGKTRIITINAKGLSITNN